MTGASDITFGGLAAAYLLLAFPLAVMLWYRIPLIKESIISVIRMTVQLLLVGLYLEVVFKLNSLWLTSIWLIIMVLVADLSIIQGCQLRIKPFIWPLIAALGLGTVIPTLFFVVPILNRPNPLDAQYAIPIGGMILGNCLRADIVGIKQFYESIRRNEKAFQLTLAQGATLSEATRHYLRDSFRAAMAPTVATMATLGLVSLPGMMTGAILGGASPMTAIKYQIAIFLAIFSGTAITVFIGLWLTRKTSFTPYGTLNPNIFKPSK